ncbi:hypothetical protein GLOIN_2v1682773 [Rhizophagus irregularis DAOM 181602=DAOM 197198]|nr:hypothetical protein GLOIN_2v1682773 [Rhizophagus irregularis DAOM 181602=DAOM 197198]
MAPRPGYGIPLGGISPMAAPDSEIEKLTTLFIGGYHDDWMEKFSRLVVRMMIKKLILKPMKLQENDILLNMRLQGRERCMIQTFFRERAAARERERQREEEERANRRAEAEKERERSHGRENRERTELRRESYILDDKEEEQRRQAKRKTETAFKGRERPTMAT